MYVSHVSIAVISRTVLDGTSWGLNLTLATPRFVHLGSSIEVFRQASPPQLGASPVLFYCIVKHF